MNALLESTAGGILKPGKNSHFIYPTGKPRIPHLLRCRGFAVKYYGFTLDALDLRHPRLLQRWGEHGVAVMDRKSLGAIGAEDLHFLRISIACDLEKLEEGVRRIAAADGDVKGFELFRESGELYTGLIFPLRFLNKDELPGMKRFEVFSGQTIFPTCHSWQREAKICAQRSFCREPLPPFS